jgi:hypothetical protein
LATAAAVVIAVSAFAPAASAASSPAVDRQHPTINTFPQYDQAVGTLGCPNSTTYGETITVPANKKSITQFRYYMGGQAAAGQAEVVRGELYAWDGSKATGSALFQTKKRKIAYQDSLFHWEKFKTPGVTVTPGQTYVLFVSIDKDFEKCTGNYGLTWGATDGSAYPDGQFVFQNNTGDESQWTSAPWNPIGSLDAVMKVYMS